ncbi:succinylglutamate desuccinylase/aspartoacylase family protein [Allomuricauda sp. d1]|uniref:succinylglutamate desuccinylase/aspartoacylase family protein n=1 Tax=Allomuricauda sp. d1 TaxID=3136725 RepID=UPI0031DA3A4B
MPQIFSKALDKSLNINRIIGKISGKKPGPTVVFFGGVHGNEPAGVFALQEVFHALKSKEETINGTLYGVAGNLSALQKQVRYQIEDLNRIWFPERIANLPQKQVNEDEAEMLALYELLHEILDTEKPPFYFIDLHTTSGQTAPFIVVNDSLLNRKFVSNYPLPIILGIEEYLTGALLSHINELGYVAFGYESGQHDDPKAIENAIDFINYTLAVTGAVTASDDYVDGLKLKVRESSGVKHEFYEIRYQHTIKEGDAFKMLPGFINFQKIPKGKPIALNGSGMISTKKNRRIFMPLYQNKGSEGFYFIKKIPVVFLWISKFLRKLKADHILVRLPGIEWATHKKDTLLVNQKIVRFLAKSLFHLLGYRTRQFDKDHLIVKNREAASKTPQYKQTTWY